MLILVFELIFREKAMKSIFGLFLGFVALCGVCIGQPAEKLRTEMLDHLNPSGKKPVHSIQVYISKPGAIFCEAVGFSDGKAVIAEKDNQFKIASITKTMTSVVILQMEEEGLLSIDDKISKYLGDLEFVRVEEIICIQGKSYGAEVSIRQLLQHSSGIADIFTDAAFRFYVNEFLHKKQEWNSRKLMERFYKYGLNKDGHFIPGEGYFYSDVNYFLLGLIIEKISGQSLANQFRSRIFNPLKMNNTYFEYYEVAKGNGKTAHSFFGRRDISNTLNTSYDWAGGGVVSTTTDLALFLSCLFEGKIFKEILTLQKMTAMVPHNLKTGKIGYYGLGISQYVFNGDLFYGHAGFWGAFIAYCPDKQVTFCGSINQVNPGFDTRRFIEKLIYQFTKQDTGKEY